MPDEPTTPAEGQPTTSTPTPEANQADNNAKPTNGDAPADTPSTEDKPKEQAKSDELKKPETIFKRDNGDNEAEKDGEKSENEDGEGDDKEKSKPEKVEYEDFTVPEGFEQLTDDNKKWLQEFGQENGLNQEQAQKVVDKYIAMQKSQVQDWYNTVQGWKDSIVADPELGGNNLDATLTNVNDMVRNFSSGEEHFNQLQEFFIDHGAGNHPAVVRLLNNIAKGMKDDNISGSGNSGGSEKLPPEKILYPNMS